MFASQPPAKPLWICDLTYWRDSQILRGTLPAEYRGTHGFLQLHLDLGVMPYYIYAIDEESHPHRVGEAVSVHQVAAPGRPYNAFHATSYDGVQIRTRTDGDLVETTYTVEGRSLTHLKQWLPASACYGILRYPVKDSADLAVLRSILGRSVTLPADGYAEVAALWGEHGVPAAPLPRSPMSALTVDWMGLESFIYAVADAPEEVRRTMDLVNRVNDEGFRLAAESEIEVFHFCDNLSAASCASLFEEWAAEYYRARFRELHDAGKTAAVHIDGTVRGLLGQMAATGADAAEALTPAPVGDMPVETMRGEAGNDTMILWGGLPGALFTPQYPREALHSQTMAFLECFAGAGPWIAGSADQIPPDAELERVRYVADLLAGSA